MIVALIILSVVLAVLLVFIGYDALSVLVETYSHFHMGRWSDLTQWKNATYKVCKKWAVKTPTLKLREDCRYLLMDRIRGKYGKKMVQSWQKAGCVLGVYSTEEDLNILQQAKTQLIDDKGNWKITVNKIDYAMLAYALLKAEKDKDSIKNAMDKMVECIEDNLCADGMVSYSAGKNSKRRYVDTLGFICPFLGEYGNVYNKPEYIDLAVRQIELFREKGFYKNLPVHCFQPETEIPLGVYGWGRGMGWYSLGLTDLYLELKEESRKEQLKSYMIEIAENWKQFENDGFSTIVQTPEHYDTSATVMLGYFYAVCGKEFNVTEYTEIAKRCLNKVVKHTKISGVIDGCLGDTKDIGVLSQRYSSMPFIQGMAIRLYSVLYW